MLVPAGVQLDVEGTAPFASQVIEPPSRPPPPGAPRLRIRTKGPGGTLYVRAPETDRDRRDAEVSLPLFEDRSRAESFGSVADLYDRARPTYPPALIDALLADGGRTVLDVGCGTGIASALFAARGCAVTGVEVDARMAEIARGKGLEVEVSSFEQWDDRGRRFDVVASGQAWHWIDPTAGAIRAADVLRDQWTAGGVLELRRPARGGARAARADLRPVGARTRELLGCARRQAARTSGSTSPSAGSRPQTGSGRSRSAISRGSRTYRARDWTDFLATHSDHQALEPARREQLLDEVADAVDAIGGTFEMPFETALVTAARVARPVARA